MKMMYLAVHQQGIADIHQILAPPTMAGHHETPCRVVGDSTTLRGTGPTWGWGYEEIVEICLYYIMFK